MSTHSHVLGIDVGGTKVAFGVVSLPEGQVRFRRVLPTQPERGSSAALDSVARVAGAVAEEATAKGVVPTGVGLGICELVDPRGEIMSANCLGWRSADVRERLGFLGKVVIEADVRAAALAEASLGAGRGMKDFVYVTIGTGISCCLVLEGRPYLGARGATGTMASSALRIPCEACGQINERTLEELSSGPGLMRLAARAGHAVSAPNLIEASLAGDRTANEVIRRAGEALGSCVAMLVNVLDPEALIIGGGLGLAEGPYWNELVAATRRHVWSEVNQDLPIVRAETGANAGIVGAALCVWQRSQGAS